MELTVRLAGPAVVLPVKVGNHSVRDWMTMTALYWKKLRAVNSTTGVVGMRGLADYGRAMNLLECVPTYQWAVPALNAYNVFMMRTVAAMNGSATIPGASPPELVAAADRLAAAVQTLYVAGSANGVWACLYPDGSNVTVRHVIDFITIAPALAADLSPVQKQEMVGFVERELRVHHWLRALSPLDGAAASSDRKDHGPYGSYDGWAGELVEAFCSLGMFREAVILTRDVAVLYDEGPGTQAHQIYTDGRLPTIAGPDPTEVYSHQPCTGCPDGYWNVADKSAAIGGVPGLQYFATSGSTLANRVLTGLFGLYPPLADVANPIELLRDPKTARGFNGRLEHVA
eukprot:SAG22_NODE_2571_length_2426_cov_1.299957_2_plen_342_part_01